MEERHRRREKKRERQRQTERLVLAFEIEDKTCERLSRRSIFVVVE